MIPLYNIVTISSPKINEKFVQFTDLSIIETVKHIILLMICLKQHKLLKHIHYIERCLLIKVSW